MHATLEKLFKLVKEKKGLKQAGLFGGETPPTPPPQSLFDKGDLKPGEKNVAPLIKGEGGIITFEEILKLYEESWIDDWYKDKEAKRLRKKQGREILKVFYDQHRHNWPEVLFLEKRFNLKIAVDRGGYIVRGAIDRIDQSPNGLILIDYKTGRTKKDLKFEDKEQLFIYQLAAAELLKQPVSGLAFYYLETNSRVEFIGSGRDLEKIKNKIISTIKEIGLGKFPPKPGRLCAWCDFKSICEFRQ